MGDGGPIHVEARIEGPDGDGPRPDPGRRLARRRNRWTGLLALAALAALLAGGLSTWLGGDDRDGGERDGGERDEQPPDDAAPPVPPRVTWARTVDRLERAGSFAYRGTVRAREPSGVRPGAWLADEVTVEGTVLLLGSISREVATDRRGRAVETVTSGPFAWSRTARTPGRLAAAPWVIARSPEPMAAGSFSAMRPTKVGPALLAAAVEATGNHRSDPPDGSGRLTLRGTVAHTDRDDNHVEDLLDRAEIVLVLDEDGHPVRIRLTTTPADDPRLVVDLTLDRLGDPDLIAPADVTEPIRRTLRTDVLDAAGVRAVELGRLPPTWGLVAAEVQRGDCGERCETQHGQRCPVLHLSYAAVVPPSDDPASLQGMSLTVASDACRHQVGSDGGGAPIRAGPFSGTISEPPPLTAGSVSDGVTSVDFVTGLPAARAARVLESLVPFDPAREPSPAGQLRR